MQKSRINFGPHQILLSMGRPLTLCEKKFIETSIASGQKSPSIALNLGVSVHVVRKWASILKKKNPYHRLWVARVLVLVAVLRHPL